MFGEKMKCAYKLKMLKSLRKALREKVGDKEIVIKTIPSPYLRVKINKFGVIIVEIPISHFYNHGSKLFEEVLSKVKEVQGNKGKRGETI